METNQIRVLDRAIDILDAIRQNGGKARITQISKQTGLPKSTIFRILSALISRGYVQKPEQQEQYSLGYKLIEISLSAAMKWDVIHLAEPFLEQIRNEFNETGALAVKVGIQYSFVAQVPSQWEYRVNPVLGERYYLHWAGTGKAILAFSPEQEIREICSLLDTTSVTGNTIRNEQFLREQLAKIIKDGFAYSYSERIEGGASISVPIIGKNGLAKAAVSIIAPEVRLRKMDTFQVGKRLAEIAAQLQQLYQVAGVLQENFA